MTEMTTTQPDRWDRLHADLTAAGITARLDRRPYAETRRGRPVHGVASSIFIKVPGAGSVEIGDRWWAKNPDVWTGWEVYSADPDGIDLAHAPLTKKRSEAVAAVRSQLARMTA